MASFMLAVVHNKMPFPVFISNVLIKPHGTEKIDLPDGFKYDLKKLSVSYITNVIEKNSIESKETVEIEEKPVVNKPKPKRKTRERNVK